MVIIITNNSVTVAITVFATVITCKHVYVRRQCPDLSQDPDQDLAHVLDQDHLVHHLVYGVRYLGPHRLHGRNLSQHGQRLSLPDSGCRIGERVRCCLCILRFYGDGHDLDFRDDRGAIARPGNDLSWSGCPLHLRRLAPPHIHDYRHWRLGRRSWTGFWRSPRVLKGLPQRDRGPDTGRLGASRLSFGRPDHVTPNVGLSRNLQS